MSAVTSAVALAVMVLALPSATSARTEPPTSPFPMRLTLWTEPETPAAGSDAAIRLRVEDIDGGAYEISVDHGNGTRSIGTVTYGIPVVVLFDQTYGYAVRYPSAGRYRVTATVRTACCPGYPDETATAVLDVTVIALTA